MVLTIRLLGLEFLHLELCESTDTEPEDPPERGHTGGTVVGFVPRMDVPDMAELPSRGWEE